MKKDTEYIWKADIDGQRHIVRCVPMKTLFEVFVDDELAIQVPRKMKHDNEDSEYDLKIGNKWCSFVLYDGAPDVAVDGILLGAEEEMARKDLRNKILKIVGGILVILVCTYAAFLWYVFEVAGEPIFGGVVSLLGIFVFMLMGVGLLLSGLKKKKEY